MKKITLTALGFLATFNLHASAPVWIGVEPLVMKAITNSHMRVFEYSKVIKGTRENYYLVDENQLDKISHFVHHKFNHCGGYRVLSGAPEKDKLVIDKEFWPNEIDQLFKPDYSINQQTLVNDFITDTNQDYMNSIITHLSSYYSRYYKTPEGVEALKWIGGEWERLTKSRNDVSIEYYKYATHDQPSVILTIQGSDDVKKDQIIIIGGHGDSINTNTADNLTAHAPGADDNAAGIAVISDVIRALVEKNYKPLHTIQFIAYAAEEVGIQGSYELAHVYHQNKKQVIGVLQIDGANFAGKSYQMALISDATSPDQNNFLAKLIDQYVKVPWTWDQCGYGCSDHAAWNYEGYRASYPVEAALDESNHFIHTDQDTFDKSNFSSAHAVYIDQLAMAYMIELDQ